MRARLESNGAFRHEAFFYRGEDEFLAGTVPFVREAVRVGEPAFVAVSPRRAELISAELGGDADGVQFVDMRRLGRNPACILPAWRDFVKQHLAEGSPVRGLGEPAWPGRSPEELEECKRHEWLLNLAFADAPGWWLRCPYDANLLAPDVLEAARKTHPHVAEKGSSYDNDSYCDPHDEPDPFADRLPPPRRPPERVAFTLDELPAVRRLVEQRAAAAGLDETRLGDLLIAVSEIATNSLLHGGGRGTLSLWREGELILCEVRDAGVIEDPLVGRERPEPSWPDGRGLWITNQLCDLSQIRSLPGGNVVRVQMSLN